MYLIWILDNFEVKGQNKTERAIKYLMEYQNFFRLDEETNDFRLLCKYKFSFIISNNKSLTNWLTFCILHSILRDAMQYTVDVVIKIK